MAKFNKFEREKYGISVREMSNRSGLTVDRVREIEDTHLRLMGTGSERDRVDMPADSARMFKVVDTVKAEQDKVVEALMGWLVSRGVDVSLKSSPSSYAPMYCAELSRTTSAGHHLSSTGRGRAPLSALTAAIDTMREVVGGISGLFPLNAVEPNTDPMTAKDFPLA